MSEQNIMRLCAMAFILLLFLIGAKYENWMAIFAAMIFLIFGDF